MRRSAINLSSKIEVKGYSLNIQIFESIYDLDQEFC